MKTLKISLATVCLSALVVSGCTMNRANRTTDQVRNNVAQNQYRGLALPHAPHVTPHVTPHGLGTVPHGLGTTPYGLGTRDHTARIYTGTGTAPSYSDVPTTEWYADYINWGSGLGLVDGYPDGTFKPDNPLSRAEIMKIIRMMADKGYITVPTGPAPSPSPTPSPSPSPSPSPTATPAPTASPAPTPSPSPTP